MTDTNTNNDTLLPVDTLDVLILGCGTVGYAIVRRIARDLRLLGRVDRLTLLDFDTIEEKNRHSCPQYADCEGRSKTDRLSELADNWRQEAVKRASIGDAPSLPIDAVEGNAATFDYGRWMSEIDPRRSTPLIFIALDDPDLRIGLDWPLRIAADDTGVADGGLMIQASLDRDLAQVCCFGLRWGDPCQLCGLVRIPSKEPCVLFSEGQLVRGDLQREAREIAELAGRICTDRIEGQGRWRNTRSFVELARKGSSFRRISTEVRSKSKTCPSAHDRSLAPMTF